MTELTPATQYPHAAAPTPSHASNCAGRAGSPPVPPAGSIVPTVSQPMTATEASAARHASVFGDVHAALNSVVQNIAYYRKVAQDNDEARAHEIAALREKVAKERMEHREQINRFRFDFDELVHAKIENLIDCLEKVHRRGKVDSREQKEMVVKLRGELRKIQESTTQVAGAWERYAERFSKRKSLAEVSTSLEISKAVDGSGDVAFRPGSSLP
mmetsp:Transcript_90835/g.256568  ORF Transcript_90835/g.256568 Transcript_90835/m.256568 type:complete len:214 (+) Transcript_90835:120-761(+)|eukprot:CAMPEP_0117516120 /NCGR_PEP_ID=MMETSP0784-20121206/30930_1 /TAXON_ID=39447 /ORGANISM="" /LENGTH=213 /DNA_ID=CAMNT_0005311955 /DNA_START=42 /DNA_END=683 /DNA_ORIENTATION=-